MAARGLFACINQQNLKIFGSRTLQTLQNRQLTTCLTCSHHKNWTSKSDLRGKGIEKEGEFVLHYIEIKGCLCMGYWPSVTSFEKFR